jgi:hypothetical protein
VDSKLSRLRNHVDGLKAGGTASWLSDERFAASYTVMEELPHGGGFKVIRLNYCDGGFPTEYEAHAIGLAFGRAEVDRILANG